MAPSHKQPAEIYLRNFGCASNIADGETIAGCLAKSGYKIVSSEKKANVLIYNTCAVKTQTENKVINVLKNAPKNKTLIVAGCLPLINPDRLQKEISWHGMTGPAIGQTMVDVLERVLNGEKYTLLVNDLKPSLTLPRLESSRVVRIMPICYGCLGTCTYCCVRSARGSLRSHAIREIVDSLKGAIKRGFREIWLTAQDLASYGRDIDTDLVELLREIDQIEGDFLVRLGMMNPDNVVPILRRLIDVFRSDRFFKFLHLPLQSGDDMVLRDMGRKYTAEIIRRIVSDFREKIDQFTLATDLIFGFPTESDVAFNNSLSLLRDIRPDVTNVSRFFPRPMTPATNLVQLPQSTVHARGRALAKVSIEISTARNREWLGWEGKVLVDERRHLDSLISRNFAYKPIAIKTKDSLLGEKAFVRVNGCHSSYLSGILLHF